MNSQHTAVWIDHHEAHIFEIDAKVIDEASIRSHKRRIPKHEKGSTDEHHHPDDNQHFFHDVAKALEGADQILLVGPSTAKLQFFRYVHDRVRALEPHIVGLETVDHPTDAQLVAYAKSYFQIPVRAH